MTRAVELAQVASLGVSEAFKNRIINGDMRIDQRNAGAEVNPAVSGSYYLDRWVANATVASKFKIGQNAGSVTPPAGFSNYLGITSLSAYTVGAAETFSLQQRMEGFNTADLGFGTANAKTVTLSFIVYSSLTGTFGGSLRNAAGNRSYPFSYSIPVANTWTQISITIAGDTTGTWVGSTNGIGLNVFFGLGVGSTFSSTAGAWAAGNFLSATGATSVVGTNGATWYITGVQIEVGSSATSFEYLDYGSQLIQCQRYYQKTYDINEVPGANTTVSYWNAGTYSQATTITWGASWRFPVEMRASPTATAYTSSGTAGSLQYSYGGGSVGTGAVTEFGKGTKAVSFYHNGTASGMTVGGGAILIGHIVVSAEL